MKNFEIPANEINALEGTLADYYEGDDDMCDEDDSDIFPATFKITKIVLEAYFKSKGVDPANVKVFNSEGDGDHEKLPKLSAIMSAQWGYDGEGEDIESPFNSKSDDLYFKYGWSANFSHFYELTINNKPAILIDGSDGTSCSMFSWIEVIFAIA